jgi:hypothetical protein
MSNRIIHLGCIWWESLFLTIPERVASFHVCFIIYHWLLYIFIHCNYGNKENSSLVILSKFKQFQCWHFRGFSVAHSVREPTFRRNVITSIFRVQNQPNKNLCVARLARLIFTLTMEMIRSSETSVNIRTIRLYIQENGIIRIYRCENL